MNQLDPKQPVSLEDLLHLKRAEQPPETFWLQFESELRAKQLAAIVDRPSWYSWRNISRLLARQSLPIGATAALALGLLSFQGYRARSASSVLVAPVAPAVSAASQDELDPSAGVSMDSVPDAPAETAVAAPASLAAAEVNSSATSHPTGSEARTVPPAQVHAAVGLTPAGTADPFSALVGSPNHPAQPIAPQSDAWSHFGDQQLASNSLATAVGFTPHGFSAPISEPLAQMATPLDERRAMLLSGSLPRAETVGDDSTALNSDDRSAASHLSDDRLYESVSRLGVGGNRLSIRF
jgi:hypothetical protein